MALPTLNLDDLGYEQLLGILRSQIPGDEWSDHNASDPGIALLELISWLGEMDLYRLNRVPLAHRAKFLKLLIDPPVPVTVKVTLELEPARAVDFDLPPGLRVASDYVNGRRIVFESYAPVRLPRPGAGDPQAGELSLRAIDDVPSVVLGVSNGKPDQTFALRQTPVVLDLLSPAGSYDPNPRISVGGVAWQLRPFLRTPASRRTAVAPAPNDFMFEEFENQIRFGDGEFGAVPPPGAVIVLTGCQVLEGPPSLVKKGQLKHLLNLDPTLLAAGETLRVIGNSDAEGGENFPAPDEGTGLSDARVRRGLETFRNPTRLVTAADFERVATDDFNRFQRQFNLAQGVPLDHRDDDTVRRAVALMNRKVPLVADVPSPGHVTLMILPHFDEAAFNDKTVALSVKAGIVKPSPDLIERLLAFLEPRRLITTRLHVVGPELKAINASVSVVVVSQSNASEQATAIEEALRRFLSVTGGYDDRHGWPLGRAVRRSQLFRVLEDLPGVDHVESLALSPADARGDVLLDPRQLPVWDTLVVQVRRA